MKLWLLNNSTPHTKMELLTSINYVMPSLLSNHITSKSLFPLEVGIITVDKIYIATPYNFTTILQFSFVTKNTNGAMFANQKPIINFLITSQKSETNLGLMMHTQKSPKLPPILAVMELILITKNSGTLIGIDKPGNKTTLLMPSTKQEKVTPAKKNLKQCKNFSII